MGFFERKEKDLFSPSKRRAGRGGRREVACWRQIARSISLLRFLHRSSEGIKSVLVVVITNETTRGLWLESLLRTPKLGTMINTEFCKCLASGVY